jgi:hypothetical protein
MGVVCRKCGVICCDKNVRSLHELDCNSTDYHRHENDLSKNDHAYVSAKTQNVDRTKNNCTIKHNEHSYVSTPHIEREKHGDRLLTEGLNEHDYSIPTRANIVKKCPKCMRNYKYHACLVKHLKYCKNIKRGIMCRQCNSSHDTYKELHKHRLERHPHYQTHELQAVPWDGEENAPWNVMNATDSEGLKEMYTSHMSSILAPNQISNVISIYNLPCTNAITTDTIWEFVKSIYLNSHRVFKVTFATGLILKHIDTDELRIYKPFRNTEFFDSAFTISDLDTLNQLKDKLSAFDLHAYTLKQRPDTKLKAILITNVQLFVFETVYSVGCIDLSLPDYLTKCRAVKCFTKHKIGKHNRRLYEDYFCSFRCITYHKNVELYNKSPLQFELETLKTYKKWQKFMKHKFNKTILATTFTGIETDQFHLIEECFQVSVDIYEKHDKDTISSIYKSKHEHTESMQLNLYDNHLCYITNFKAFAKRFSCKSCGQMYTSLYKADRHEKSCKNGSQIKYKGGLFHPQKNIWEDLEFFGIQVESIHQRYLHHLVYDYECILQPLNILFGTSTNIESKHKPISVSTAGNCCMRHRKPLCIVEEDFDTLISKWLEYMDEIVTHTQQIYKLKWKPVIRALETLKRKFTVELNIDSVDSDNDTGNGCGYVSIDNMDKHGEKDEEASDTMLNALAKKNVYKEFMSRIATVENAGDLENIQPEYNDWTDSESSSDEDGVEHDKFKIELIKDEDISNLDDFSRKKLLGQTEHLYNRFMSHVNQVPCIGFNASRYDLLISRAKLIEKLGFHIKQKHGEKTKNPSYYVIKRGRAYPCISTDKYKFLDISEYLGPSVSYAKFLQCMKVKSGRKLFFPYEAATSLENLITMTLPDMHSPSWFSTLKQKSVLDDGENSIEHNYDLMKKIWCENDMVSLLDLLKFYNNQDTEPLLEALNSFQNLFFDHDVSIFKGGIISVPGASRQLLFSQAQKQNIPISLFDCKTSDLYESFKKQTYGGLSIIFKRHHRVGKTYLRHNPEKMCQLLEGWDGCGLYLSNLSDFMPVGFPIRRHLKDDFKPITHDRYLASIQWMDWLNKYKNKHIKHRYNSGGSEKSLLQFKVDGFDIRNQVCYEFNNCFYHGHHAQNRYCYLSNRMDPKLAQQRHDRTIKREAFIRKYYKLVTIYECSFNNLAKVDKDLQHIIQQSRPEFYRKHKSCVTKEQILSAVTKQKIYGFIECDLEVDENELSKKSGYTMTNGQFLSEMCPIFGSALIMYTDIQGVMKDFIDENNLSRAPRKQLISSLSGKKLFIHTFLLQFYIDLGIKCTTIYQVVEYSKHRVFKPFADTIMHYRRQALQTPEMSALSSVFKIIGNSGNPT